MQEQIPNKLQGVDIEKFAANEQNVYGREVWNAAIERAAMVADESCERITAGAIRGLKK